MVDAKRRHRSHPPGFFFLSREDAPNMPPLDTQQGQDFINAIIEITGGIDLVVFDNMQALLTPGDDFGAASWEHTLPWVRDLTARSIGQIWVHHTGRDETHAYGTTVREWQLDIVGLLERVERPELDIAFKLSFPKARERSPDNRANFEPAVITLENDKWTSERGDHVQLGRKQAPLRGAALVGFEHLKKCLADAPVEVPPSKDVPPGVAGVTLDLWRRYLETSGIINPEGSRREQFRRIRVTLQERRLIRVWAGFAWLSHGVT